MKARTLAALAGAALVLVPAGAAHAGPVKLPPPGAWYAVEGVQCATMNVPKGGREGVVHQFIWKDRDGVLRCEFGNTRRVRS